LLQIFVHQFYGPRWMGPLMKIFIYGESLMVKKIFKPVPLIRNLEFGFHNSTHPTANHILKSMLAGSKQIGWCI